MVSATLVGQINILGFSLGIGAVLFVGLAIGAIAPKAQIAGPIGLIGLIMFLYGIGILYGRQFFEGLTGPGRTYNLLALVAVVAGLLVALGLGSAFGVQIGHTLGIFAGSMTSTATLQAALDVMGNKAPSIGYSVAYPFGVIGPILCFYFLTRRVKPEFPPKPAQFHMAEITIERLPEGGRSLGEIIRSLPAGVQVSGVRQEHRNRLPDEDIVVNHGDALLIAADSEAAVAEAAAALGRIEPGRIAKDRSDLSYQRFFVSKVGLTGTRLADLPLPADVPIQVLHVRRYDVDLVPAPDLMLEIGDRVGVIVAGRSDCRRPCVLRRHGQVDRGVQLCLRRLRHGARRAARPGADSGAWRGHRHPGHRRRPADRRADRGPAAPHRSDQLGHAAAGQHRAAQFWPDAVPRHRRHQFGPGLRDDRMRRPGR